MRACRRSTRGWSGARAMLAFTLGLVLALQNVRAALPRSTECIVPAKPGGGFDLSCTLAAEALLEAGLLQAPMRLSYLPGGIGAMAYHVIATKRSAEAQALVAFSGGSLLNLAQGRFGPYTEKHVRWVAAIGVDHGVIAVRQDSPLHSLRDLVKALKTNPNGVVFGAGGTIGSQDWMKAALLARAAGVSHKLMRFVAFEGGGEAISALQGGHVQVLTGDVAEVVQQMRRGAPIRVLAVLSQQRLPGSLAALPTAREQGLDIQWPILRGFYVGPQVDDAAYREWVDAFAKLQGRPHFQAQRERAGLQASDLSGAELDAWVRQTVARYRSLADEFELRRP